MDRLGKKGQAAITDAMYFLLIVSGLCVFLFVFSATYGENISRQIDREFNAEFTSGALKTILYSSTPRDTKQSLYEIDAEIDHLLAFIKEDYADDEVFSDETMVVLASDVSAVMSPYSSSHDYLFTIWVPNESKYVYTLLHLSMFTFTDERSADVTSSSPAHVDYLCGISGNLTTAKIDKLTTNVGNTASSFAKVRLVEVQPGEGDYAHISAEADLVVWNPKYLGSDIFNKSDWDCIDLADLMASLP